MSEPPISAARAAAPPWASGVVTGVETAVLSAGLVFAFVFVAVAAAPSADGSISADWSGAWNVGTSIWLLAHGVPATVGEVTVTLVPLGLTLVIGIIAASVARRAAVPAHSSVAWAALTYGLIAAVVSASDHGGAESGWRAGVVGGLVVGTGTSLGLARAHGFRFFGWLRLPVVLSAGTRLGAGLGMLCLGAGVAQALAWQVSQAGRIAETAEGLAPDLAGGLVLAVGETGYVPTLSVWALAWLAGGGFSVGSGSRFSPGEVIPAASPDLPILASLPEGATGSGLAGLLVLVALGALARFAARRWLSMGREGYLAQAVGLVVVGVLMAGAALLASGSAGGGALREVGTDPVSLGLRVALLSGIGVLVASGALGMAARTRTPRPRRRESPAVSAAHEPPHRTPDDTDPLRLW